MVGAQGTYRYLSHYGSLGWGFRLAIALVVGVPARSGVLKYWTSSANDSVNE
jgi:hypothetical protein